MHLAPSWLVMVCSIKVASNLLTRMHPHDILVPENYDFEHSRLNERASNTRGQSLSVTVRNSCSLHAARAHMLITVFRNILYTSICAVAGRSSRRISTRAAVLTA